MSTTVTYKGSTIATVDNATKTLLTAGKYMEDDVTLVDVSGGGGATPTDLAKKDWPSGAIEILSGVTVLNQFMGFQSNTKITSLKSDYVQRVEYGAFRYCSNLESIDLPECVTLGSSSWGSGDGYVFASCPKLTRFNLPKLESINQQYVFADCGTSTNKALIALPAIKDLNPRTFRNGHFSAVDLGPNLSTASTRGIRDQTFYNGSYDVVILRPSSVVPVTNADAIAKLTTANGCTIYVPNALISTYESSTGWSSATRTYVAIEGSYYATHYADGTVIS